ncbi:MAG: ThiF family adenylyltransferase [Candidatus Heimdallarchaeota archaeon]|nr:ThiF family adenylyltransferase [Candidatus Heimdallarchaeota archaeon]
MSKYDRQMRIDGWSQEKLDKATVFIAGIGALGSFIATNLALSGVGRLILCDMDTIELTNLNRQLLFRKKDIRKYKSEVAAKQLRKLNPDIEIISLPMQLESVKRSYYEMADVIIAGLDSFDARRWLNSLAVDLKKPLVSGGMYGLMGQVQRIIPYDTPCFECQPLIPQDKLSQACSPVGEKRKHMPKKPEAPMPAVATMSMIIGGIMSQVALKHLMKLGSPLDNYLFYDGMSNTITILKLERKFNCPVCGGFFDLEESTLSVEDGERIDAVLTRIAYTFGLADPKVMLKGVILDKEMVISKKNLKSGDKLFVMDDRLAKPLKLIVQKQTE